MLTIFAHAAGRTRKVDAIDPAWLGPESEVVVWVDLANPVPEEARRILSDVFHFHDLAVEDALSQIHHPKIETYDNYLYLILHGIDFEASQQRFATHDIDFFLGPTYLVTVHDGTSRSIRRIQELCERDVRLLGETPAGLLYRILDLLVDGYAPEVEKLEERLEVLEQQALENPDRNMIKAILGLKRDISTLRRITLPQRDLVARLARREFPQITDQLAYRFRDIYDQLVRFSDEALSMQDRVTGILDAYLSTMSNRLNEVMKVLTVIATIFMPLTVLTGMYGMNVHLPHLPGGETAQFWWILGIMVAVSGVMLWLFWRRRWI